MSTPPRLSADSESTLTARFGAGLSLALVGLLVAAGCSQSTDPAQGDPATANNEAAVVEEPASDKEDFGSDAEFVEVDVGAVCDWIAQRPLDPSEEELVFDVLAVRTVDGAGGSCVVQAALADTFNIDEQTSMLLDPYYEATITVGYRPLDAEEDPYGDFVIRFGDEAANVDGYGLIVDIEPGADDERFSLAVARAGGAVVDVEVRHEILSADDAGSRRPPPLEVHADIFRYVVDAIIAAQQDPGRDAAGSPTAEAFYGDSAEQVCFEPAAPGAPRPTAESYGRIPGEDGIEVCVGPALLTSAALENVEAEGTDVNLVFLPGADGIDQFNAIAELCFNRTEVCPSQRLALVLNGQVLSSPTIQVAAFDRDQIVISGGFSVDEASRLADEIRVSILSGTNLLRFRPVILQFDPDFDLDLGPSESEGPEPAPTSKSVAECEQLPDTVVSALDSNNAEEYASACGDGYGAIAIFTLNFNTRWVVFSDTQTETVAGGPADCGAASCTFDPALATNALVDLGAAPGLAATIAETALVGLTG